MQMIDVKQVELIRRRLKRTWLPFFTRFGRLTPVQVETIPKILDGANVVVASPTASGKTEAVVAPVAERFAAEGWRGLAILYIVPTRALANDTLERIEGPLEDMGITAALKHGDKPSLPRGQLPNCLITTPESLDSLICRRSHAFGTLRAVILDEIHLLDNTYRGDQLRLLLWRLRKLTSLKPQASDGNFSIHLLSATLSEPDQIAQRYISPCPYEVIAVEGGREIDYCILDSYEEVYHLARKRGWRKVLAFCNLRESVEAVAAILAPLWQPYPVVTHHGSLSRTVREEAETVMKEAGVGVCVATSTLEIGIDIGDIDLILLAEPPRSLSTLLQRIGRGNRRKGLIHAVAVVNAVEEKPLLEAMFETADSGVLPAESYVPDLSVAVQQILSYLYQNPKGAPEPEFLELLSPLCSSREARRILRNLRERSWIESRLGHWLASSRLMDFGEKGHIHSNIPDSQTYKVLDIASGREIGTISGVFDDVFILAQSAWQIVSQAGDIIRARRFQGTASAPVFQRHKNAGAFHSLLPSDLKGIR